MSAGHSHVSGDQNERSLWIALGLTSSFLVAELVGGILTGSLALISDAAHMFTDAAALAISVAAVRIGQRPADQQRSFGYYRFEILAAAFNALLLFGVALYILYKAYQRLHSPPEIHSTGMLAIAALGLIVNLVSMRVLQGGHEASLNVKGAYLEVWSDLLGSIGVIIGALIIRYTGWTWIDSAVAVGIGLWVLPRTWVLLKESVNILLEGVPKEVDMADVREALLQVPGVDSLHDLHIWAISSGKISLTVHLVQAPGSNHDDILDSVGDVLASKFDIRHITVQCELTPCGQVDDDYHFPTESNEHDHEGHGHEH